MNAVRKIPMLATAGVLALAAWAPLVLAGHTNPVLEADLDGKEEVTAADSKKPGDRNASGKGYVFGIDGDPDRATLCYILTDFKNLAELDQAPLAGQRMAHIHKGKRGENGPVVVNLAWPQDGQAGDCFSTAAAGKFTDKNITPATILANPQDFYINVHNSEFPAGAVRGQLMESGRHGHSHDKKN